MTTIYVKSGGTSGGPTDFDTLANAIANGIPATLTVPIEIEIWANAGVQQPVTISGKTTSATNFIRIYGKTGDRHLGVPDTSSVRIETSGYVHGIICSAQDLIVEGIQFTSGTNANGGIQYTYTGTAANLTVRENYFGTNGDYGAVDIEGATGGTINVRNNMHRTSGPGWCVKNMSGSGYTTNVYNNTSVSTNTGAFLELYVRTVGTMVCTNNIGVLTQPGASPAVFSGTITQSYNTSSDTTATGTGSLTSYTPDFVNLSIGNLHLHPTTDTECEGGTNLSGTFTTDIDGQTRSTWYMGADELVTSQFQAPRAMLLGVG